MVIKIPGSAIQRLDKGVSYYPFIIINAAINTLLTLTLLLKS
jgi:hypothetical protein